VVDLFCNVDSNLILSLCGTGDADYVDRYRHIHCSKPLMIPVDRPVIPHEGNSALLTVARLYVNVIKLCFILAFSIKIPLKHAVT